MSKKDFDCSLYLVTDGGAGEKFYTTVEQAVQSGATMVQLREKMRNSREFYETALRIKKITSSHGVPLIINDRLDIALAVDAEGLHVGQEDLPVAVARKILGPDKILGATAATVRDAMAAERDGADYLGSGAVFPTSTKASKAVLPMDILMQIKKALKIPVVAIGGITPGNMVPVLQAGVDGVAVVSAIMASSDPAAETEMFKKALKEFRR